MIDHTGIGVANVGRSAAFYDAALGALGMRRVVQLPEKTGVDGVGYGVDYPVFWIDRYHPHSLKHHTAFAARSKAEVDADASREIVTALCPRTRRIYAARRE